jgi:hypothetical protein
MSNGVGLSPRSKHILVGTGAILALIVILAAAVPTTSTAISHSVRWSTSLVRPLLRQPSKAASCTPARPKRLNVLHYIDKKTHDALMDRWFSRSQEAFQRNSQFIADAPLWGPGFEGYDTTLSLTSNVRLRYKREDYFDAILPYYNGDQVQWLHTDPVPTFRQVKELSQRGNTVVIDRPHEMRDARRVPIIERASETRCFVKR